MLTVKFNTALIVGAGSGLSAALARVLATEGINGLNQEYAGAAGDIVFLFHRAPLEPSGTGVDGV